MSVTQAVDSLIRDLNASTRLCWHATDVIAITPGYVDLWAFESKYRYTRAMRLHRRRDAPGRLERATCLNFEAEARFVRPDFSTGLQRTAQTVLTAGAFGASKSSGPTIKPVPTVEDGFKNLGYAGTPAMHAYVSSTDVVSSKSAAFKRVFDEYDVGGTHQQLQSARARW